MRGIPLFTAIAILGLSTGSVAQVAQPPAQVKVPTWTPVSPRAYQPQPAPRSSSQLPKIPTGTGRCGQLAEIINSDGPNEGALASLEHAVLRGLLLAAGIFFVVIGLALGVTLVMLPAGVVLGLFGVATLAAAFDRGLPLPPDA